jgi:hypothetical protein
VGLIAADGAFGVCVRRARGGDGDVTEAWVARRAFPDTNLAMAPAIEGFAGPNFRMRRLPTEMFASCTTGARRTIGERRATRRAPFRPALRNWWIWAIGS